MGTRLYALLIAASAASCGTLPASAQNNLFPQTLPPNTLVGRTGIGPGPAQAIPFSALSQLFTLSISFPNTWTATQTFTPSTLEPGIVVNGFPAAGGTPAMTIAKGLAASSALNITSNDTSGRMLSIYGPASIGANVNPPQYFDVGGFHSLLAATISGVHTGTGDSYAITPPTLDAFMLGIYADVPKAAQFRCAPGSTDSLLSGSGVLSYLTNDQVTGAARYTGAILCSGTLAFGALSNTTYAGMDTFFGRGAAAATFSLGGADSGAPVAQTLGVASVAAPISSNQGFLAGFVFHFAGGIPAGILVGQTVVDTTNPAFGGGTVVSAIDRVANTVTTNQIGIPYQADIFTFNGANPIALTNQLGSTRIAYGSVPTGVTTGQVVTDTENPTAIPGATTVSSIDTSLPAGSQGNIFLVLSAAIDGVLFNTAAGGHDLVVFSTLNTAAADLTFTGGKGTGTGNGGKLLFRAAPAATTGSTQNPLSTFVTIDPNPAANVANTQVIGPLSVSGQLISTAGLPTIASGACGTGTNGAVVAGSTNQSGNITIGASATTTCVLSWSATLTKAPNACVFFPANAAAAVTGTTLARTGAPSTSSVTLTGGALANSNYSYICL